MICWRTVKCVVAFMYRRWRHQLWREAYIELWSMTRKCGQHQGAHQSHSEKEKKLFRCSPKPRREWLKLKERDKGHDNEYKHLRLVKVEKD